MNLEVGCSIFKHQFQQLDSTKELNYFFLKTFFRLKKCTRNAMLLSEMILKQKPRHQEKSHLRGKLINTSMKWVFSFKNKPFLTPMAIVKKKLCACLVDSGKLLGHGTFMFCCSLTCVVINDDNLHTTSWNYRMSSSVICKWHLRYNMGSYEKWFKLQSVPIVLPFALFWIKCAFYTVYTLSIFEIRCDVTSGRL